MSTEQTKDAAEPVDRVALADCRHAAKVESLFTKAGLAYPAQTILLRAFKHERELEVWGQLAPENSGFRRVVMYPVLGASGVLGPKLCEGDCQVPEGFYRITRFNPRSRFHLSLGLDYPNPADLRRTTHPHAPGSDIFIHGGTESKGCLAMGDEAIEEIYLEAHGAKEVLVHLFPCRMTAENWQFTLLPSIAANPSLEAFWRQLQRCFLFFEAHRSLPEESVALSGL